MLTEPSTPFGGSMLGFAASHLERIADRGRAARAACHRAGGGTNGLMLACELSRLDDALLGECVCASCFESIGLFSGQPPCSD